jgi:hypothetical protein
MPLPSAPYSDGSPLGLSDVEGPCTRRSPSPHSMTRAVMAIAVPKARVAACFSYLDWSPGMATARGPCSPGGPMPGPIPWRRRSSAVRSPHPASGFEVAPRRVSMRTLLTIRPYRRRCQGLMGPPGGVRLESSGRTVITVRQRRPGVFVFSRQLTGVGAAVAGAPAGAKASAPSWRRERPSGPP